MVRKPDVDGEGQKNVRSVVVKEGQNTADFEQKMDQLAAALTLVAKKLTGVTLPLGRKGIVDIDHVTPAKGLFVSF